MKKENNKKVFPKGFFTKIRTSTISSKNHKDKDIPFKWSDEVLSGKTKVKIVSNKNN